MEFVYNEGGRKNAGYKGDTDDCVCRAIAIATQLPYQDVYEKIKTLAQSERRSKRKKTKSHPRTGVYKQTIKKVMLDLGWEWVPTMFVGQGCKTHLRKSELPAGRLVVSLSRHVCAVINGVVHDTHCDDRNGTRCVYGYWQKRE